MPTMPVQTCGLPTTGSVGVVTFTGGCDEVGGLLPPLAGGEAGDGRECPPEPR